MVNGCLLDTVTLLWSVAHPERLTAAARSSLERGPVWVSVLSYWEVAINASKGKLDVGPVEEWWVAAASGLGARVLPLRVGHVSAVARLPLLHRDPFDRALIAQAIAEDLTLLSPDREIARYATAGLRVIQ